MGNTLDSHDQIRIMSLLEGDMTMSENGVERAFNEPRIEVDEQSTYQKEQVLFCYLLTVPGVPIIYYGDEFGMTGANDPDNRRMMRFGDQLTEPEKEQLKRNSKLIQLRKEYSALRRGDYLNLYADDNVMIYSRGDAFQRLIIALNKNNQSEIINLTIPDWMAGKALASLINGKEIPIKNQTATFALLKFGYDVFILE
jgi:glycosidase